MDDKEILATLNAAATAVKESLVGFSERGYSGLRETQYKLDLVADAAACQVLLDAGIGVVSEESGVTNGEAALRCVVDPIDGSTNCDHGVPFFATSLCVLDDEGPRVGLVRNQATGVTYSAIRGQGAWRDGVAIAPSSTTHLSDALMAFSGLPTTHHGWAQFRVLGAASLEICLVADGGLDAYLQAGTSRINPWDYLAGMLICNEAGAVFVEQDGLELVVEGPAYRRPVVAGTADLAAALMHAAPF
jgi:fructose-1,6-bisphosphatase/inositol monophosphatase family enzyme